jgi:hypothetical protein
MPRGKSGQRPENTRELRGAAGNDASGRAEFSGTVKRGALSGNCAAGLGVGTALANIEIPLGCVPIPSLFPHGGARNSASRTSEALTLADAKKLLAATKQAIAIGRPFNRFLTVHWQAAGLTDREAMAATMAFLKYLREWLRCETAYVWTRENGGGKGSHLHILASFPQSRKWNGWIARRWVERITGNPYKSGVVLSEPIVGARQPDSALYAANLQTVLAYILKGASPDVAASLGLDHEFGGRIIGKRCGTSRNIAKR